MYKNGSAITFQQKAPVNPNPVVTLAGHSESVQALTVLPDGRLASGSWDKLIRLWDPSTGLCMATLSGHTNHVNALTISSNGCLVSASQDGTIRLWDENGACIIALASGHTDTILTLTSLPGGRLATGSADRTIRVWSGNVVPGRLWGSRGECLAKLKGHTNTVLALTVLPDGRLASGGNGTNALLGNNDNAIRLWDISSGACVATMFGHSLGVKVLKLLPDGRLASGSGDGSIKLWNVLTGSCEATLSGHSEAVVALTVLPDGRLASGSHDHTIKLWDVDAGTCLSTLLGHSSLVVSLTALQDGRLASGAFDGSIKLWDVGCRPVLAQEAMTNFRTATQPAMSKSNSTVREESSILTAVKSAVTVSPVVPSSPSEKLISDPFSEFDVFFSATSSSTAAAPAAKEESQITARKAASNPPAKPARKASVTPPKSAATTVASEASERDTFPTLSGLSLSQTAGTIAFSELELGEELGRGGFGVVCEALWQSATKVAVKQLIGRLTPDLLEEFQRETNVHAGLRHPNIILLYGICVESMRYAMVMEFMASGSLYDVLRNPVELPWSLRLSMALDFSLGLLYLHGRQIIHRDLKSLNILVDGQMRAKVSDFGLSKIKLTTASMTKGGGGTPHWMAPELFDEAANTSATDVYASGIVFWEIAARKLPYEGKNQMQIGRFVEKGNRETMPEGTPPQFAKLMMCCWAQLAEDRPDMRDVARDMRKIRSGDTTIEASSGSASPAKSAAVDSGYIGRTPKPK